VWSGRGTRPRGPRARRWPRCTPAEPPPLADTDRCSYWNTASFGGEDRADRTGCTARAWVVLQHFQTI